MPLYIREKEIMSDFDLTGWAIICAIFGYGFFALMFESVHYDYKISFLIVGFIFAIELIVCLIMGLIGD